MWGYHLGKLLACAALIISFDFVFCIKNLHAAYLTQSDLEELRYSCYVNNKVTVFCSFESIDDPDIIVQLPLLKPVKLNNGDRAYRLMAIVINNMVDTVTGTKIRLKFRDNNSIYLDILITEQIKYQMSSTVQKSHLIRGDIPKIRQLYEKIDQIYYSADISILDFEIMELHFKEF